MFAGAGTVKGRAVGALINALRPLESFDMFGLSEGGSCPGSSRAIKNGSETRRDDSEVRSGRRKYREALQYEVT